MADTLDEKLREYGIPLSKLRPAVIPFCFRLKRARGGTLQIRILSPIESQGKTPTQLSDETRQKMLEALEEMETTPNA